MTEIRVYPEHDKIVVTHEVSDPDDVLIELVSEYKEWQDDGYAYYRMPLHEFMEKLKNSIK